MRKEDKITVNGLVITVKELTVAEVRHWLMDLIHIENTQDDLDAVDHVMNQNLFEEIGLPDILRMTDLTQDYLNELTPTQLRSIVDKCKVVNPDFFGMRKRILDLALRKV